MTGKIRQLTAILASLGLHGLLLGTAALIARHPDSIPPVSTLVVRLPDQPPGTETAVQSPTAAQESAQTAEMSAVEQVSMQAAEIPLIEQESTQKPTAPESLADPGHPAKILSPLTESNQKTDSSENGPVSSFASNEAEEAELRMDKAHTPSSMPFVAFSTDKTSMTDAAPRILTQALSGNTQSVRFTNPVPLAAPDPPYPLTARRLGIEGTVELDVSVDENGYPVSCLAIGPYSHSILEKAAIRAVMETLYTPGTVNDVPTSALLRVKIVFRLE